MKQVKFLMGALTILMGTMVTSCMNGETNTIVQQSAPMRVKSGMFGDRFISGTIEVVPTNSTLVDLPSGTKIAIVPFQYDSALQPITENTKTLNVDLLGKPQSIDAPLSICPIKDDILDVKETHAVGSLTVSDGYSKAIPYILPVLKGMVFPSAPSEYFMIVPIGYKIKSVQKEDELKAELAKHAFTMVLYTEEITSGETSMVIYLRHVITETGEKVERTTNNAEYKAFDLQAAIAQFKSKSGVNPTKVIIKAMENTSSDDLKGANEKAYEQTLKVE